jgi:hypothetical protein
VLAALAATACSSSGATPNTTASKRSGVGATATSAPATSSKADCAKEPPAPTQSTATVALRRTPDAAHPLRVVVAGDSLAETLNPSVGVSLVNLTKDIGVPTAPLQSVAEPGYGFTSWRDGIWDGKQQPGFPPFRNWQKVIDDGIAKYDPDVVVMLLGSWDMVQRKVNGHYIHPPDCAWAPFYGSLLNEAWRHLTAKGARVMWLAFPCTAQEENPFHHKLNAAFRALADAHPRSVAYVDLDRFACPHGTVVKSMTATDGKSYSLRGSDNTHFDFYGAPPILAPYFEAQFRRVFGLSSR